MAAPKTPLSARIHRLEIAKSKADKFKRADTVSAKPMCEVLNVTWKVLREWCDDIEGFEESGCFVRGGNGIEWEFNVRKTVDYLLKHFRAVSEKQAAASRKLTKSVGVSLPAGESAPSMAETKDLVNLTLTVVGASERQGLYTRTIEVAEFLEGYNEAVVTGILGGKTKVDPNGNLPISVRKALDEYLRSLAAAVHARAEKYIEGKRAGIQQRGIG